MTKNEDFEQYSLILAVFALFALIVLPLAQAVFLGFLVALVVFPFYQVVLRFLGGRKHLGAFVIAALLTVVFIIPLALITIAIVKDATVFVSSLSLEATRLDFSGWMGKLRVGYLGELIPFSNEELRIKLQEILSRAGTFLASNLASFATSIPLIGLNIVILLVSFFYALVDGPQLTQFLEKCLPFGRNEVSDIFSTAEKICRGVVMGSLVAGLVQGLVIGTAYGILGVPGAFLFGAMTAIFSFIPILGCAPAGFGGTLYLYMHDQKGAAIGMLIATLVASLSDYITKPLVLRGSIEIHPLLGLVSALGGLAFFGFVGLFLGPLFGAFLVVILDMIAKRNALAQK